MGSVHPPLRFFLFLALLFKIRKVFLPVLSELSNFSDEIEPLFVAPQNEGCTPPINLEVFFSEILAILYGLETWFLQSSRHFEIILREEIFAGRNFANIGQIRKNKFLF